MGGHCTIRDYPQDLARRVGQYGTALVASWRVVPPADKPAATHLPDGVDTLNVAPFNGPWFLYMALIVAGGIGLHFALRRRTRTTKAAVLSGIAVINVTVYVAFTARSIINPDIPVYLAQNLPFHLCNLVALALIAAPWVKWRWFLAFCAFPGVVTGALGTTSPIDVYLNQPLLSLPALGFYGVHAVNAVLGTLLVTLAFYQPNWRDAFKAVGYVAVLTLMIFPLNLAMRAWIDPATNYFYIFDPENAQILQMIYDLLPVPLLYVLLLSPIAVGGFLAINLIHWLAAKRFGSPLRHLAPDAVPPVVLTPQVEGAAPTEVRPGIVRHETPK
ncbi:MAG: YwaF family protein [Micrococcales bacterium]|nr:YwaF family protein [Micrococcales bacterium]